MTSPSMILKNDFAAAWKAGSDHDALLELVRRHQAAGLSAQEAYTILQEVWVESGFNDSVESHPLQDNLEFVLETIWYQYLAPT